MIETDWRIEETRAILCGSSSDKELWTTTFERLVGKHVVKVAAIGRLPEVLISLSDDIHVTSFATFEGDPAWALFDRRGPALVTVYCRDGVISEEQNKSVEGREQSSQG